MTKLAYYGMVREVEAVIFAHEEGCKDRKHVGVTMMNTYAGQMAMTIK